MHLEPVETGLRRNPEVKVNVFGSGDPNLPLDRIVAALWVVAGLQTCKAKTRA